MVNTCIVCGRPFSAKQWNQRICSEDCRRKRQHDCWMKHMKEKELRLKQEEKELAAKKKAAKPKPSKSKVTTKRGDPKWVKDYAAGDRLTQIAMLARALNDYKITDTSYGKLSLYWDTKQYFIWESIVISRKRKEKANDKQHIKDIQAAAEEGTFEGEKWP